VIDADRASERTQLAWQRFAFGLAVIGALGLRAGLAGHRAVAGFAVAAVMGALAAALQLAGPRLPHATAIGLAFAATLAAAVGALALAFAG
jgi:uncharacterized membrane protein YidH (DUF202 family)